MPKRKSILQRGSVGRDGVNWWLNLHLVGHGKSPVIRTTPDNVSGQIDVEIVRAIKWFQAKVVQLPPKWQDGRVDPKGWTLESLLSPAKAPIRYRGIEKRFEEFDVQEWWDSHKWKPLERSTWIPKAAKDWARIAPKANVIVKVFKGSDSNWGDIYVWKSKNPKLKGLTLLRKPLSAMRRNSTSVAEPSRKDPTTLPSHPTPRRRTRRSA